jgi:hypothetical protein
MTMTHLLANTLILALSHQIRGVRCVLAKGRREKSSKRMNVFTILIIAGCSSWGSSSVMVAAFAPTPELVLLRGVQDAPPNPQRTASLPTEKKSTRLFSVRIEAEDDPNLDLSGNTWKPAEDDLPLPNDTPKVAIPGMETLGEDALVGTGIEMHEDIPTNMDFIPSNVIDGTIHMQTDGQPYVLEIAPFCMGYEDYYAGFTNDSDPVFRITSGAVGRMDRRGGETARLEIIVCEGQQEGDLFQGTLVVNLPDDGSRLTYSVNASSTVG